MEQYQFVRQIGQGSYGDVWLVKCSKTRKKHVLKRIDMCQTSKREQRAAYLEAKLLSTINHPNLVSYIDSFHNSNGSLYIVMSYCEFGDLRSFIKNQNGVHFEEKQVIHWFIQICLALKYLHDKNILHRNLKTKNIFLSKNKVIKVGDLGISRVLSAVQDINTTLIETPYYISPEILAGDTFNKKSDIWALGCCMYEIATLKHPFIAQDIQSIIQKIKKGKLPPIPDVYSIDLYNIISSMLHQKPEKRPCVTKLLLNPYIRRYILIILQDNPTSPNKELRIQKELAMDELKSNSELYSSMSKSQSIHENSKLACLLSEHAISSCNSASTKTTSNSSIISIPDINGNGDGNDNSQHRKFSKTNKNVVESLSKTTFSKDYKNAHFVCPLITAKCRTKSDSDLKESLRYTCRNGSVSSCNSTKTLKCFRTNNLKTRSEISFRILNNITYILHNQKCKVEGFMDKSIPEIKHFSEIKSADCATNKKRTVYPRITAKKDDRCTLPQISCDVKGKTSKSAESIREFPSLNSKDSKSISNKTRQHIHKKSESKIDGSLVNKKIIQKF